MPCVISRTVVVMMMRRAGTRMTALRKRRPVRRLRASCSADTSRCSFSFVFGLADTGGWGEGWREGGHKSPSFVDDVEGVASEDWEKEAALVGRGEGGGVNIAKEEVRSLGIKECDR